MPWAVTASAAEAQYLACFRVDLTFRTAISRLDSDNWDYQAESVGGRAIAVEVDTGYVDHWHVFEFDVDGFLRVLDGPIYGRRFTRYVTLKLDFCFQNHDQKMHFDLLSVEHILPQNPADDSDWVKAFSIDQRNEWTDKLAGC